MKNIDEFIAFAKNSRIVIADYESRLARLEAMLEIQKTDDCPILRKWIVDAQQRLEAISTLYHFAKRTEVIPTDQLVVIWEQLKELKHG